VEQRRSARVQPLANVLVYQGDSKPFSAQVRSVNRGGLFVAAEPQKLDPYTYVELELTSGVGERLRSHRFPALVVRRTEDGAGLKVDAADPITAAALAEMTETAVDQVLALGWQTPTGGRTQPQSA
jgi:hypothetical protein